MWKRINFYLVIFGNHGANGASEASDMSAVRGAGSSRTLNLKIPPFPRSALHPGPPEGASEASIPPKGAG